MSSRAKSIEHYHPWTAYIAAREEARRFGDNRVGTDHLVLGLLREPEICSVLDVTLDSARETLMSLDRQALVIVGIGANLDVPLLPGRELPNRPTVKAVWKDRLPLTPAAKAALQEVGKPMRHGQHITAQQVLRALLENKAPDPAMLLFDALGVDVTAVRQRLAVSPAS